MNSKNEITILGAYGTKGHKNETSSFWITRHHVIDAGNLLRSLGNIAGEIDGIWLTHSHLDHIMDIAYILDSYFDQRAKPLKLMGLPQTLNAVKKHFLNDVIWPDFSKIPLLNSKEMSVVYVPIEIGEVYELDNETSIMAFKTDHTVPSCGYVVKKNETSVLITADTYDLSTMLEVLKEDDSITSMVVECSFPSSMEVLAKESKHLTPQLLFERIKSVEGREITLYINHIKPLFEKTIIDEIAQLQGIWKSNVLKDGDKITF